MRKAILVCFMILPCTFVLAQAKHGIGVYTSFFNSGSKFDIGHSKTGGSGFLVEKTSLIGAEYNRSLNQWLKLNIGIEYSDHKGYESYISGSGLLVENHGYLRYISVPLYLRADLWKYFFFTFGTIIDLQTKSDLIKDHSAIGVTGGTGFKYDFKKTLTVFVHPFYELHSISSNAVITGGLRSGISFRF